MPSTSSPSSGATVFVTGWGRERPLRSRRRQLDIGVGQARRTAPAQLRYRGRPRRPDRLGAAVDPRRSPLRRARGAGRAGVVRVGLVPDRPQPAVLEVRRARGRAADHARRDVPRAGRGAVRPDAVRGRDRRAAGAGVRAGDRRAAHRDPGDGRDHPGPDAGRGGAAARPAVGARTGAGVGPVTTVAEPALQGPTRVHPLTPFLKGWGYLVATFLVMAQNEGPRSELRATLIATASGLSRETLHPETNEAPQRELLTVPTQRLLGSTLLSSTVVASGGGLATLVAATMMSDHSIGLFAGLPLLLGVVQPIWKAVIGNHGFTVYESPDGLRTKRGLLDLQRQTVPPGRVQGLVVSEPILWRLLGWAKVDLDIAGVAGRGEVADLLHRVLPGLDLDGVVMHRAPDRAKWLRPVGWRYLAYGADDQVLVTVRGWVNRRTSVVLHHKTQSVRATQGPLQRRLRLASIHIDTPQGPADAVALHRDVADAASLLHAQADRARQARRSDEAGHARQV